MVDAWKHSAKAAASLCHKCRHLHEKDAMMEGRCYPQSFELTFSRHNFHSFGALSSSSGAVAAVTLVAGGGSEAPHSTVGNTHLETGRWERNTDPK